MSSKVASYYDWSLGFKRSTKNEISKVSTLKSVNSLGMSDDDFKGFLKQWKKSLRIMYYKIVMHF
ncbi:MAG: hypothetical protein ACTSP9_13920 [Promethearchaeota archaeon]